MGHIVEAFRVFRREPRLWRYAWGPLAVAMVVFLMLAYGGWLIVGHWVAANATDPTYGTWLKGAAAVGYLILVYFAGTVAFLALAALFGSFLWDRLTGEVETIVTGRESRAPVGCAAGIVDSVTRLIFTLAMTLVGIGCSFIPFIGSALIAGVICLFDFTANAYLRRGVTLGGQFSRVFKLPGWGSFVAVAGVLTLLPFVNVLMLPLLVAGATIMVIRGEGSIEGQRSKV